MKHICCAIYHLAREQKLNRIEVFFEIVTNFFSYSCKVIRAPFLAYQQLTASLPWYFNASIFLVDKVRRTIIKSTTIHLSFHRKVVKGNSSFCNELWIIYMSYDWSMKNSKSSYQNNKGALNYPSCSRQAIV